MEKIITSSDVDVIFAPIEGLLAKEGSIEQVGLDPDMHYLKLHRLTQQRGPSGIDFIGSMQAADGHWFAIHAEKDAVGNLTLFVADSAHTPAWFTQGNNIITCIMPYVYLLAGKFDRVKPTFKLLCKPL